MCKKNNITCAEIRVDELYDTTSLEVKGRDPKITWEKRRHIQTSRCKKKLADRNGYSGRTTKRSITGGNLNVTYADWNGHAEKSRGTQVWENGYTQVVNSTTRRDTLLDVYLVRPENAFTSCSDVQGISDLCGVLLEVEWGENCREHQVERCFCVP